MYEFLNTFKWKPNPKFQWKLINFEKPQNFSKTQNLGFKTWNAWMWKDYKLTKWRKTWKTLKNPWEPRLEWDLNVFGRETEKYQERDRD